MASKNEALSSFIQAAPPGELSNVIADIRAIAGDGALNSLSPAFQKYNEAQFTTVKLPGASQSVIVSEYNSLGDGRYFDVESATSFSFDHTTQKASNAQSHPLDSPNADLVKSTLKSLQQHSKEHYPAATIGVFPSSPSSSTSKGDEIAIITVSNKYSPNNFWNGRWRSQYLYSPSSGTISGSIKVDVHYYEDGNVRLSTSKPVSTSISASASGAEIVKSIAAVERKYQEELNRGFAGLSEGAFKGLRRQLPVTRQKMEWEKVASYRVGQDIGGTGRGK